MDGRRGRRNGGGVVKKQCNTCVYFDILRTPTGRPKRGELGRCEYSVTVVKKSIIDALLPSAPVSMRTSLQRITIIPHWMDPADGADCPAYDAKEPS
jgi:hypothetical protein